MMERIDREGIKGDLELVTASEAPPEPAEFRAEWAPAAEQWDGAVAALAGRLDRRLRAGRARLERLPRPRGAADGSAQSRPVRRRVGFRFRVGRYGYGAAPEMTRRCFERLDTEGIGARVTILHALADTKPVMTQGPVWYRNGGPV